MDLMYLIIISGQERLTVIHCYVKNLENITAVCGIQILKN